MKQIYSLKVKNLCSKCDYYYDMEGTLSQAMIKLKKIGKELASNYKGLNEFHWRILNEDWDENEESLITIRGTFNENGNPTEIKITTA